MSTSLGKRVRELRLQKGLTLEKLAHRIDSGKSYMWEIENKDVVRPSAQKLSRIAEALETTVEYLLTMNENEHGEKEKAEDSAFYKRYKKSGQEEKKKIRKILDILNGE